MDILATSAAIFMDVIVKVLIFTNTLREVLMTELKDISTSSKLLIFVLVLVYLDS